MYGSCLQFVTNLKKEVQKNERTKVFLLQPHEKDILIIRIIFLKVGAPCIFIKF